MDGISTKNARIYMTFFDAAGRLMLMLCRRSHAEVLHRFCTCGFPDVVHGNTATGMHAGCLRSHARRRHAYAAPQVSAERTHMYA